ncbi:hypothetical protein BBF96_08135 [Anoxybacter fermentans]|uniref:Uncharacterized protein n=1 Tax=Anoxybacter fermentans TaxID=1323375 RepID=A0A3S9SYD2_9FIRM|nr:DUF6765 family protein [Anoxybacter fermentans]AZR73353.1 hypothetical protein BBF96_08135 [Anoxybacter fermentans]
MQKDLHHAGTYVLCRIAGMKSKYAKIVAYAAQQVDDATHGHALKFENGGLFKQTMTAHKALSPLNLDVSDALEVWIPFHFLPRGKSMKNPDGLITGPDSKVLKLLLEDIEKSSHSPLALYRLGIGLHCYADTFTHQDFKGFCDKHNDITLVSAVDKRGIWESLKMFFINNFTNFVPIGHVQALANPDIPNAIWSYCREDGVIIEVNNLRERFIPALESMYCFLYYYLQRNTQFKANVALKSFRFYSERLIEVLKFEGNVEERHKNWLDKIHQNYFEFEDFDEIDKTLSYDPREWFREAVEAVKVKNLLKKLEYRAYNYYLFRKKENFYNSNWVRFMRAAAEHKFVVVNDILPKCGVNVG